jgi:hypothetical protein
MTPRRVVGVAAALVAASGVPPAAAIETSALIDSLQHGAFDYFWNEANPANGLVKDRSTPGSPCSIAAVGFGLSAICIGIDHGWVTREAGRDRVLTTLETFWNGPQGPGSNGNIGYQGLFYHFLDMTTATRTWTSELSTIDSALLFAGVIDCGQYFDGAHADEVQIRALADAICHRANWEWARNSGVGIRMGWTPESGFGPFGTWVGYNEAMILYILALGSPTFPVPASTWFTWTSGYDWSFQYGQTYINFPPLFGHQYSHCWIDFRSIQDIYTRNKGITYFENSRRATLAQRAYCIANPFGWVGYGADLWGITASDDPGGYVAHGAPPPQNENGTITPTAAASSIPFAPSEVIPVLHNFYDNYPLLWGPYGFRDAFNLTVGWWDTDYLGIDQGPIILMMENHLNGSVWSRFMQNADIQTGLSRAGFLTATGVEESGLGAPGVSLSTARPNPFHRATTIHYNLSHESSVSLVLYDVAGRKVRTLAEGVRPAGVHRVTVEGDLPAGVYYYRLQAGGHSEGRRFVVVK